MPIEHFCQSCNKAFSTIAGVKSHARAKHHVANPFVCEDCELSFEFLVALEAHLNSPKHAVDYASDTCLDAVDSEDNNEDDEEDDDDEPYCESCERRFTDMTALNQHLANSLKHNWCFECSRDFKSQTSLQQHLNSSKHAVDHPPDAYLDGLASDCDDALDSEDNNEDDDDEPYCEGCERRFTDMTALNQHLASSSKHNWCFECSRDFKSETSLQQHSNSLKHAVDYTPNDYLDGLADDSDNALDFEDEGEGNDEDEPYCEGCQRQFIDMIALNQHLLNSPRHNWCFECSRDFKSTTALQQHRSSLAHSGRDFKCPFCSEMFKSPSGIALHVESGCHKLTRHQVTAAVHKMDIVPSISIKRITGPVRPPTTLHTFIATEASFNGSSYDCCLCSRKFKTLCGLNSHLNSPAHDDDEFRCPKCKTEFKLISGFVQHLESRSCGLAGTTQIDDYFKDLTTHFSRLLKL